MHVQANPRGVSRVPPPSMHVPLRRNTHASFALKDTRNMASFNEKADAPILSELPTVPATRRLKVPEGLDKKLKEPWVPRANQVQAVSVLPRPIPTSICAEYGAHLGCLRGAPRPPRYWRAGQEVCDAAARGLLGFRQGRQVSRNTFASVCMQFASAVHSQDLTFFFSWRTEYIRGTPTGGFMRCEQRKTAACSICISLANLCTVLLSPGSCVRKSQAGTGCITSACHHTRV